MFKLSPSQSFALERLQSAAGSDQGQFLFVTGKAGTGKSTVLRKLRETVNCITVAPTGLAAINVGGETIHRFFGLSIGPMTKSRVRMMNDPRIIEHAQLIVIDEISMVRADTLDAINWVCQKTMDNTLPFGGKTIVAFGDMWQLEPVVTTEDETFIRDRYASPFWFDAHVFGHKGGLFEDTTVEIETLELTDVFRQIGNPEFIDALNAIRSGDS